MCQAIKDFSVNFYNNLSRFFSKRTVTLYNSAKFSCPKINSLKIITDASLVLNFTFMCIPLCLCGGCTPACRCPQRREESVRSLEQGSSTCEPSHVSAGNWTQVLYKSSLSF